jgi:condensin complex subunit 2
VSCPPTANSILFVAASVTYFLSLHCLLSSILSANAIFEKKKATKSTKATKKDQYQMPQADRDFLLPPDANVDISQLTRLFSRPNAVVRKSNGNNDEPVGKTVGFHDIDDNALGFNDDDNGGDFDENNDGGFTFAYDDEEDESPRHDDADYNIEFDEVRKVEKINIAYATVAKKVDVRRLKQDLWAELEEKTARVAPEVVDSTGEDEEVMIDDKGPSADEPRFVSFKETVEKMEMAQSQNDVTVSFYFICCLHLANEKGLKLDSTGLEDFLISLDDGSAPTFGTFGNGFTETANKLSNKRVQG